MANSTMRADARAIWDAAVAAADPIQCVHAALASSELLIRAIKVAHRICVVGGGKAGAGMAAALERELVDRLGDVRGIVNVPAGALRDVTRIQLHVARPSGTNEPTAAGIDGAKQMLQLVASAEPHDLVITLISGGGSALLPAPVDGVSLEDKQFVTRLLHRCGATIGEMNCVRKHLSRIKGGGLAAIARCPMHSLMISDVVGDPLDVIASGPTAPDPTTFADALAVLRKFQLLDDVPATVRTYLEAGTRGERPETLKLLPPHVHNLVVGNNSRSLAAAESEARTRGYSNTSLGPRIEGETQEVARDAAATLSEQKQPRVCVLIGGETTVTLPPDHGKGGRNTEFVLAALLALQSTDSRDYVVLSGGTDGEDGPTDAAGAVGDDATLVRARALGLDPDDYLRRHDSYSFFHATGDLIRTGLTQTNVMDVRVLLAGPRTFGRE